jgi:hypothetical protein
LDFLVRDQKKRNGRSLFFVKKKKHKPKVEKKNEKVRLKKNKIIEN